MRPFRHCKFFCFSWLCIIASLYVRKSARILTIPSRMVLSRNLCLWRKAEVLMTHINFICTLTHASTNSCDLFCLSHPLPETLVQITSGFSLINNLYSSLSNFGRPLDLVHSIQSFK